MLLLHLAGCLLLVAERHAPIAELDAVELAISYSDVCATFSDGSLRCSDAYYADDVVPPVHALSGSGGFCGIGADDSLQCWNTSDTPPLGRYRDVAMGGPCALTTDGEAVCWGISDAETPGRDGFVAIGANGSQGCAIDDDGELTCWYYDGADLVDDAPAGTFADVTVNYDGACALRDDGGLRCWGRSTDADDPPSGDWETLTSSSFSYGAVSTSGELGFWGDDVTVLARNAPAGAWRALAMSDDLACGIDTAQKLACWGDDPPELDRLEVVAAP